MRRPHQHSAARRSRLVRPTVMISERPAEAAEAGCPRPLGRRPRRRQEQRLRHRHRDRTRPARQHPLPDARHLPRDHGAAAVRYSLTETVQTLPPHLMRSLTWNQGVERISHRAFTITTDIPVCFRDPASPCQRGSNESTNGLLRQYSPEGTDLSRHTREDLDAAATELNSRPRKNARLGDPSRASV